MGYSYAVATFDLNLLPIHRVNGQESAELPGLMAITPPRKTGRGREQDTLIVYLMLSGNAALSSFEYHDLIKNTANLFHQSSGSLTSAMRKAAEHINTVLLERNRSTTGRGLQALGILVLAAIRNEQCTLLLSGPAHAVWVSDGKSRHIYDPALSGKGLGASQSIQSYFSQVELHEKDLLTLCGKFPKDWEADLLNERPPASLEASYRKLTMAQGDLNAVLIQAHSGHGTITILRPEPGSAHPLRMPTAEVSSIAPQPPAPSPSVSNIPETHPYLLFPPPTRRTNRRAGRLCCPRGPGPRLRPSTSNGELDPSAEAGDDSSAHHFPPSFRESGGGRASSPKVDPPPK